MRFLFCCEFYHPSVGGVQEVMRQIAEGLVRRGHSVTVATTRLANRTSCELNGVRIEEFGVMGNFAGGISGEVERYREYVLKADVDAIMIKAAQQWTFDALWPVLPGIKARKVFIPCGFSGLYFPSFAEYFKKLPDILRLFDHLIFYATRYRDIEFARTHGIKHFSIIPNGASEVEFAAPVDPLFRSRHNIPEDSFIFLTVGSLTGAKGHLEIAQAFARMDTGGRKAVLILNGNIPVSPQVVGVAGDSITEKPSVFIKADQCGSGRIPCARELMEAVCSRGCAFWGKVSSAMQLMCRAFKIAINEGWHGVENRLVLIFTGRKLEGLPSLALKLIPQRWINPLGYWIKQSNKQPCKRAITSDLPRPELIQAFKNADLFVFASNIEYSPLVLFESAAAGTPFLTVPVGNSEEIAEWTGGGIICPASIEKNGITRVCPEVLAAEMQKAMGSPLLLAQLGRMGHEQWKQRFTWSHLVCLYEEILCKPS